MATLARFAWFGWFALASACGGAASKGADAPSSSSELDELSQDIEASALSIAGLAPAPASGPPPAQAEPMEEPHSENKKGEGGDTAATQAPARPVSSCETACKALGSMRRSQSRICELAGESHDKCVWAKQKVADAASRLERAGCGCD